MTIVDIHGVEVEIAEQYELATYDRAQDRFRANPMSFVSTQPVRAGMTWSPTSKYKKSRRSDSGGLRRSKWGEV